VVARVHVAVVARRREVRATVRDVLRRVRRLYE
jgi:hypothetical protein